MHMLYKEAERRLGIQRTSMRATEMDGTHVAKGQYSVARSFNVCPSRRCARPGAT